MSERDTIQILRLTDGGYPPLLKEIATPPSELYLKGSLPTSQCLAIVGTRQASPYGLRLAEKLAKEAAHAGLAIVSGLARGIDTAAHRGALAGNGVTVAVLGSGLLDPYPPENRRLSEEMVEKGGCLVSEFPLTAPPLPENFPRRNRIISGLSLGVLVVEADEQSGALITANFALEQGREVFACPGPMDSVLSRGCHRLIQQGAKLVIDLQDIVDELKIPLSRPLLKEEKKPVLDPQEAKIFQHLSDEPLSVDLLAERSHLPVQETLSTLLQLELKQLVRAYPGKRFVRC